jgi:membrane fusion protein (multidrug efflux system)
MSQSKRLPVVPQAAVLEDREGRYVFVVGPGNKARQRRIETAETLGTQWAVKSGFSVGETIIVEGIQKVRPEQPVRPITQGQGKGGTEK